MLTPEQKIAVLDYVISLSEGRSQLLPERYELLRENQNLKQKIEIIEKQLSGVQIENSYKISNSRFDHMRGNGNGNDVVVNVKY